VKDKIKKALESFFGMKIRIGTVILACVIFAAAGWGLNVYRQTQAFGGKENYTLAKKYLEVKKAIDDYYVGTSDDQTLSDASSAAMVKALGDQWSYYMNPEEYEAYQLYSANQYAGIGVSIQEDKETGGFAIISVTPDSPAEVAGVTTGEIILAVDGDSVKGMSVSDVRALIRAHLDESVTITLQDGNDTRDVAIDCTIIYTKPVTYELKDDGVGYIRIQNFESGAGDAAIAAVDDLLQQGATSLVFDVRSNPGGLLSELIKILDYLLPEGDIFVSVNEAGEETVTRSDNVCIQVPMAVLVNADSYSAAEFFAAALQDYQWATIVGENTTGKGRSQITVALSDGSAVHISNNKYLTPNRVDLSEQGGITPDIVVPMTDSGDAQLEAAISAVLSK
jgi:carboxyl-terminal processing protease